MLIHSKKAFLSLQFGQEQNIVEHSFERRAYKFDLKLPGYSLFQYRQSRQECEHFSNG